MRMISWALFGAALLQLPASFAATLGSSDECTALSQSNMRACLEKQSAASERELALAEQSATRWRYAGWLAWPT